MTTGDLGKDGESGSRPDTPSSLFPAPLPSLRLYLPSFDEHWFSNDWEAAVWGTNSMISGVKQPRFTSQLCDLEHVLLNLSVLQLPLL